MVKTSLINKTAVLAMTCSLALTAAVAAEDTNLTKAKQQYASQDYPGALKSLAQAKAHDPKNPTILYYEALCNQRSGSMAQALKLYTQIVQTYPSSPEAQQANSYLTQLAQMTSARQNLGSASASSAVGASPGGMQTVVTSSRFGNITDDEMTNLPAKTSVPFSRGKGGHLFVNVTVNGRTINCMFDTGASICLFGKNHLDAAGVKVTPVGPPVPISGVGSTQHSATPCLAEVQLGGMKRRMTILVQDNCTTPPLLGETFFNGFAYDIDNQAGLIRLTKRGGNGSNSDVPFDTIDVPFVAVGNNMVIDAMVNGRGCKMYFDTGAAMNVFSRESWAALGLGIPSDARMTGIGGVGGATPALSFNANEIRVGSVVKTNVPVVVAVAGPNLPLLGQPFFRDKRYTIDNEKHLIRFFR